MSQPIDIDIDISEFAPYHVQAAAQAGSKEMRIIDGQQQTGSSNSAVRHYLRPGFYQLQLFYRGEGNCSLGSNVGGGWTWLATAEGTGVNAPPGASRIVEVDAQANTYIYAYQASNGLDQGVATIKFIPVPAFKP